MYISVSISLESLGQGSLLKKKGEGTKTLCSNAIVCMLVEVVTTLLLISSMDG